MDIEGTYTLQTAPEAVKNCLQDRQILLHCIPGIERLEAQNEHMWAFTLHVKQVPLTDEYRGTVTLLEQEASYCHRIIFQAQGRQNTCNGEWTVSLSGQSDNTIVTYSGTIQFDKRPGQLRGLPLSSRLLIKGAIKLLLQQFFTALTEQLRVTSSQQPIVVHESGNGAEDIGSSLRLHPPVSEILTPVSSYPGSTSAKEAVPQNSDRFLRFVVRRLGLGKGDSVEEERWVKQVRRFGVLSVLLLLVWVGTRLPGKILD